MPGLLVGADVVCRDKSDFDNSWRCRQVQPRRKGTRKGSYALSILGDLNFAGVGSSEEKIHWGRILLSRSAASNE